MSISKLVRLPSPLATDPCGTVVNPGVLRAVGGALNAAFDPPDSVPSDLAALLDRINTPRDGPVVVRPAIARADVARPIVTPTANDRDLER